MYEWIGLDGFDVGGLQTLGALLDRKLNMLAFFQIAEAFTLDGREMDENVRTTIAGDETVPLACIEPLDRTLNTFRHFASLEQKQKN